MAKLIGIRFKNFLSSGNNFVKFNLSNEDVTLIFGKNGRGKSQVVDAISFALFKKPIRSINLPQLVNTVNKKDCVVELAVQAKGDNYIIRRGLKPNLFEIYKNGELIKPTASLDEYQEMLEKDILNLNYKTFKQVDVLSKTSFIPFLELKAADRRAVVEDLLDLHVYGVMSDIAKSDLKESRRKLEVLGKSFDTLKLQIQSQQTLISRQQEHNDGKVDLLKESIATENDRIKDYTDQIHALEIDIAENETHLEAQPFKIDKAEEVYDTLRADKTSAESLIRQQKTQLERISALDCCPTCRQNVGSSHKKEIEDSINSTIEEATKKIGLYERRIAVIVPMISTVRQYNKVISDKKSEISSLNRQINESNNSIIRINQRIDEISKQQSEVAAEDVEKLDKLKNELRDVVKEQDQLNVKIAKLTKAIDLCSDGGLKSLIISKYIPKINERLNHYLNKLDMFVQFTLDQEFNETILARHRDNFTYNSFSEGQKARINLALLFTWRDIAMMRNSTMSNLLFLDETFDGSMDQEGNAEITNLLNSMTELGTTIYLISHNEGYKDVFTKAIEVTSDGNFSEYVEIK